MLRSVLSSLAFAVMLDRIVVSVGLNALTESQLKEEIAVTAFLNREPIQTSLEERRAAAHRLVQQTLISRDMELARFPETEPAQSQPAIARIVDEYGGRAAFDAALKQYGLSATIVRTHVEKQLATLRFIEYRFRPDLAISEGELQSEYKRRMAEWNKDHPQIAQPTFEDRRASIRTDLIEQRTDEALDNWLRQTASQTKVTYLDESLKPAR